MKNVLQSTTLWHSVFHLFVIEFHIPNNRKDSSNKKEEKSRDKNTAYLVIFGLAQLTRAVIDVFLVSGSTHRDKGQHDVSQHKSDSDQRALAADVHHAREQRHQYARNEECVG